MPLPIEDYGLIGDTHTGALVGRDGSIDWWCTPRFDADACFAALLGTPDNGRWKIAPRGAGSATRRSYRGHTLVLEHEWSSVSGTVRLVDLMPVRDGGHPRIVRIVECVTGTVDVEIELVIRFGYGHVVPWVHRVGGALVAVAGPDALWLDSPVALRGEHLVTRGQFRMSGGDRLGFSLTWNAAHLGPPERVDPFAELEATEQWWDQWSGVCVPLSGPAHWDAAVHRSLATLKALTYAPTGGIVAAATTSLPEALGGVRNWDYRYCWLRDATFALYALLEAGYKAEAIAWRDWLLRAVAGSPSEFQILYGPAGERRLPEWEVPWLAGYEGAAPVRVGNAASNQFQLDVFGEVMDTLNVARRVGIADSATSWDLQRALLEELETVWDQPDEGIWEVRGPRRHFVHSKVMAWVAVDRAIQAVTAGRSGPVERWRALADRIHLEVCEQGFDRRRSTFTQYYGGDGLDASLLMIPIVGFLPVNDERVAGTVRAIESELVEDGLVLRYQQADPAVDGLPPGEGVFLPCSFWLADVWALAGRTAEATALFEHLLDLRNDIGLLAEEYDTRARRQVGNFPQAFSHLSLANTARHLAGDGGGAPAHRAGTDG